MTRTVTAIVPTLAERARRHTLERAVASLRAATARPETLEILVVVNGNRHDPEVIGWLEQAPVTLIRIAQGSLPLAQLEGRRHVTTPYFCFLDDDDEYLPGALDLRLEALERAPAAALSVTNGWRHLQGRDSPVLRHMGRVTVDPLAALFEENWLASCGALFRSDAVGADVFEDVHAYLEWTWIAFRITSSGGRVVVVDAPTYRIHDTPGSASKSEKYVAAELSLLERMHAATARTDVRALLEARIQNQWSMRSVRKLHAGDVRGAWDDFRRVLALPRPWRYASLFVRLLAATVRSRRNARLDA